MIFIIILFILFGVMFAIPFAGSHIGYALHEKHDNFPTRNAKEEALSRKWYRVYDTFSSGAANIFMLLGAIMAIFMALFYIALLPFNLDMQNMWVSEYYVYEKSYNDWRNGVISEPCYNNASLISLQKKIDAKKRFKEQHPFFSCYIGHALDDLDALKFTYERK